MCQNGLPIDSGPVDPNNKTTTTTATTTNPPVPTINGNVTENNYTCIRYEFNAQFIVKYQTAKNETKETHIPMPLTVDLTYPNGTCSSLKESFTLTFLSNHSSFKSVTFTFAANEISVFLDSIIVDFKYDNKTFPDINPKQIGKALIIVD